MKQLFKTKERFSIGLDIGTSTIKLVKLKSSKEGRELIKAILEPTQTDLVSVLKRIVQEVHPDTKGLNISVSGQSTIVRYIDFPKMKADELKGALKFEAEKHIPFPIAEVNLDACILKEDLPDNKMLVLLTAVRKEFVNQRLKLIEDTGFKVNIIDMDSLALINAFNFNYSADESLKGKSIALLNIGASLSNLNILEDGTPCLSRDISIAGKNFTQKLADILGLDFASAQTLKLNPDKEKLDKISSALESVLTNLSAEIRTSFDYYESQSVSSVVKIFLGGGETKFVGLKDMLANLLGIEVEYWDPLRQINISKDIDASRIKTISGQLGVAIGLALRQ